MFRRLGLFGSIVLAFSACGPRSQRLSTAFEPSQAGAKAPPVAAAPAVPAAELPTGDEHLKTSAAALGKEPPELEVDEWVGTAKPILLRDLPGRGVLIEFCQLRDTRCDAARARLSELNATYGAQGIVIVEIFVDQPSARTPDWEHWAFMRKDVSALGLQWPAAFGARTAYTRLRYGFPSVPAAYLVDRDGKLVWSGDPNLYAGSLREAVRLVAQHAP